MLHKYYVTTCALYQINNRLPTKPVLNYSQNTQTAPFNCRFSLCTDHVQRFSIASFRRRSEFPVGKDDRPFLMLYFIKLEGGKSYGERFIKAVK